MEIIEIGAVILDGDSCQVVGEFASFVRPISEPVLSDYCIHLTSIQQSDVSTAENFKRVFTKFLDWIGPSPYKICSWGDYDIRQFRTDCERHELRFPKHFSENHINLKKAFASLRGIRPCGMKKALRLLGMPLEGHHHRAIDDARNIARMAQRILPVVPGSLCTLDKNRQTD